MADIRVGLGHDIHELVEGRELWLGGIKLDYSKGLKGHSDADALLHAIMDAMLGALALGDIGNLFPDTDPQYKGISSSLLTKEVVALISKKGYKVSNLDCMIHCERPKIAPVKQQMREKISQLLNVETERVSVKAGTNEGMDAVGEGRAIACQAIVLISRS